MGGVEDAVMWGARTRVPAANAALVNGTLIHGFEIADLPNPAILPPGSVAIPAALAVATSPGTAPGRALVAALLPGFEAGIRARSRSRPTPSSPSPDPHHTTAPSP